MLVQLDFLSIALGTRQLTSLKNHQSFKLIFHYLFTSSFWSWRYYLLNITALKMSYALYFYCSFEWTKCMLLMVWNPMLIITLITRNYTAPFVSPPLKKGLTSSRLGVILEFNIKFLLTQTAVSVSWLWLGTGLMIGLLSQ